MQKLVQLLVIHCFVSFTLAACQSQLGVSGKFTCRNPSNSGVTMASANGITEDLFLNFTSDDQVTISLTRRKYNGDKDVYFPDIPAREYRYTIEDGKVVVFGNGFGIVNTDFKETFLVKKNELIHYSGIFFKGKECKKS
jgi:hypothetical protein